MLQLTNESIELSLISQSVVFVTLILFGFEAIPFMSGHPDLCSRLLACRYLDGTITGLFVNILVFVQNVLAGVVLWNIFTLGLSTMVPAVIISFVVQLMRNDAWS